MAHPVPGQSKLVLFVLMLFLVHCKPQATISQPAVDIAKHRLSVNKGYTFVDGKPAEGKLYALFANGDTATVVYFLAGRENGWSATYYPNKQIKALRFYSNGWKNGIHKGWYANGKRAFEYHFKDDMFDGIFREWTIDGICFRSMNFSNGQEQGLQTIRYANGKIKSNYVIKNGIRYGLLGNKNCENVSDITYGK